MDFHLNLEYLCRVCAANTKGKNSVAECVYILKTVGLRDKLDKFLYLKVFENDALPKVLCKSCYRQVEATASLSKIAKHTQQVFRDFLLSNVPKGTVRTGNNAAYLEHVATEKSKSNELKIPSIPAGTVAQVITTPTTTPTPTPPPPPPPLAPPSQPLTTTNTTHTNTTPRKDEVVVNVSVSDPLTRENQQKVISNSQRRHSIMVEAAELAAVNNGPTLYYVPKTIAQKSQKASTTSTGNSRKSSSPGRVLKFQPIAPKPSEQQAANKQSTQQPAQVTTFSSGGYVIGPAKNTASLTTVVAKASEGQPATGNNKEDSCAVMLPSSITTSKDNTILQQKRKNLVKALNNIKANNTGQVSLLKSSQQKQQQRPLASKPPVNDAVANVPEELPSKIIIAAPKNKPTSQMQEKPKDNSITILSPNNTAASDKSPSATPALKPSFPEDILLGRVIRDVDLLKLILKALKWPTNKQNMELQLQRLKNSRFTDIMSDSNLLQDTDLTQLLGPYLAPVLMAAQALQQQQQQITKNNNTVVNVSASTTASTSTPANSKSSQQKSVQKTTYVGLNLNNLDANKVEEINKAMPYKLPPETSVQLVPALQEDTPTTKSYSSSVDLKRSISNGDKSFEPSGPKRSRKSDGAPKHRDSIVISDEEDNLPLSVAKQRASFAKATTNNFPVDITSPAFLAHLSMLNGHGSRDLTNEALVALLQKQKLMASKQRRNKNKRLNIVPLPPSEFDALINIDDDIVLMEPVSTSSSSSTTTNADTNNKEDTVTAQPAAQPPAKTHNDIFLMPCQVQNQPHLITRPIIKRRKTVIQSAKGATTKQQSLLSSSTSTQATTESGKGNSTSNNSQQVSLLNTSVLKAKEVKAVEVSEEIANVTQEKGNTTTSGGLETSPVKQGQSSSRKQQLKATLGQQLLEAIGLQKIKQANAMAQPTEVPSSSTNPASFAAGAASTKQSVHQIRSALKKSLKQAQEQQELRNKEMSSSLSNTTTTIIQDADSTTKPTIKEIIIEGKSEKNSDSSSPFVDVEEQIDKIALVRNQSATNHKEGMGQMTSLLKSKEERFADIQQPLKKLTPARITERRSTLPSSMGRNRLKLKHQEAANKDKGSEKMKHDVKVSSSSTTTTESKDEIFATPRRRARKRYAEVEENEVESNKEKHKDNQAEPEKEIENTKTSADKEAKKEKTKESDKVEDKEKHKENEDKEKDTKLNEEKSKAVDTIKEDDTTSNSGRPTRQSKTLSKYYKGPDKAPAERRSLPARSTRNRKYT